MTTLAKPRTVTGRYPRGEETKQRVIDAAIDTFGRLGYAGTSTRDIAVAAKVNTPALQYYFGGKLGLYNACIEQLSDQVWRRIEPAVVSCREGIEGGAAIDEMLSCLGDLQSRLIDSFFSDQEGNTIRRLLAWEDAEHDEGPSAPLMKERIGLPLFSTFRAVIERYAAAPMRPIEIDMHAMSLMGLTMIFHFNQCRMIDMLDWTLDDTMVASIKAVANKQLAFALTGLAGNSRPG